MILMHDSNFVYLPIDSAVPVPSHERHTEGVVIRLSPRLWEAVEKLAEREQTSVSEIVREALSVRWGIK